jgi:hypothetical protein
VSIILEIVAKLPVKCSKSRFITILNSSKPYKNLTQYIVGGRSNRIALFYIQCLVFCLIRANRGHLGVFPQLAFAWLEENAIKEIRNTLSRHPH